MNFKTIDWIIFVTAPAIAWWIGYKGKQAGGWRAYYLAQGSLGTTSVAATYFGANLTFTAIFMVLSEEAYKRGAVVFVVPIFWFFGTMALSLLYPRLRPFVQEGMTLHQALGTSFNSRRLQRWASVWTIIAFVGTVALEFYGGIRLLQWAGLSSFANISIALLLAFTVSAFTISGGLRGVAWADIWLNLVTFAGIVILCAFLMPYFSHGVQPIFSGIGQAKPSSPTTLDDLFFAISMAIIFLPFQVCTLDTWQRFGAWEKRNQTPTKWLSLSGAALCLVYCVPVLIGIIVKESGITVAGGSHPLKAFLTGLNLSPGILGIVFAGFAAAMFSTADELLNCSSMSLLFDTIQLSRKEAETDENQTKWIRLSGQFYTGVFGFAAALIALLALRYERQISDLAIAVFSSQVVFTFPLLTILFLPRIASRLARTAEVSMVVSFVVTCAAVLAGWMMGERQLSDAAPIIGFTSTGVVFSVGLILSYFSHKKSL